MNRQGLARIKWYIRANAAAGLTLTEADYQRARVHGLVYSMARLLMRPGLANLSALRSENAWKGKVLLDASDLQFSPDNRIRLRNDYDGSIIQHDLKALFDALKSLRFDGMLWPSFEHLPALKSVKNLPFPLLHPDTDGAYHLPAEEETSPVLLYEITDRQALFQQKTGSAILSDTPVQDATEGMIYDPAGNYNITDNAMEFDTLPLAANCRCIACAEGMTRSYFHHLFTHTPLLCRRWLAIHNLHLLAL